MSEECVVSSEHEQGTEASSSPVSRRARGLLGNIGKRTEGLQRSLERQVGLEYGRGLEAVLRSLRVTRNQQALTQRSIMVGFFSTSMTGTAQSLRSTI